MLALLLVHTSALEDLGEAWRGAGHLECRCHSLTQVGKHLAVSIIVTLDLKGLTVALKKSSGRKGRLPGEQRDDSSVQRGSS